MYQTLIPERDRQFGLVHIDGKQHDDKQHKELDRFRQLALALMPRRSPGSSEKLCPDLLLAAVPRSQPEHVERACRVFVPLAL
jgi:hypothetical protein